MKICDVTQFYSPRSGGVRRYLGEKQEYVRERTEDEHYLIVPGERTTHQCEGRTHLITIASPKIDRTSRYRILCNVPLVRSILREVRPDIVESGDPYHLAWTVLRSSRELGIPAVAFYHSHFPDAYLRTACRFGGRLVEQMLFSAARRYIVRLYARFRYTFVPSATLQRLLESWGLRNTIPIRLGVDARTFCPGPDGRAWREELAVPDSAFLLLYVGRLAREKNISVLLRAFQALRASRRRDYRLLVVGDGPLRQQVRRLQEETDAVIWRPYIEEKTELRRCYRAADLFVHPGVVETFGLVAVESQACGCPVIGIRGTNMDDHIHAGLELWAHRNCAEELAEAIERAADQDLRQIGISASVRTREIYDWPNVFMGLWRYYRLAMGGGAPALEKAELPTGAVPTE
ncbi:Glycosyltransferase [Methylacidimicrobium sp. AP8]|uniref:glycosyltransferase n=1 Tax=Methylacidimicrobium sp. AP8 TaxID=2730359 RepID=UPI0018C16A7C|nr:glycosyltransferase [Methylacidimicrobium sp. AP8]CAB4244414.1 Glycosyltransferase [Methylacidimicrobium sp. AP8]